MKTTKPSLEKTDTFGTIPFYSQAVPAGFPSPADDFLEFDLSLDKKLIKHPSATFFVRASGTSMINAKIFDGSILLVDRACLLYTSPSPRDRQKSRMPSSA